MTDRERLLDLVNQALLRMKSNFTFEALTDFLIKNGVIVPPCKVGDTVYIPWHWNDEKGITFTAVEEIKIYDRSNHYMFFIDLQSDDEDFEQSFGGWKIGESIGKTVFLTPEEAKKALAERQDKNEKP